MKTNLKELWAVSGSKFITKSVARFNVLLLSCLLSACVGWGQTYLSNQSFDATTFVPTNWTNLLTSGLNSWTRVTSGSNPTCSPHSGAGMAKFDSYDYNGGVRSLITPVLDFSTAGTKRITFWMYRDNVYPTDADKIEIYTNTSANLTSATLLGTINRSRSLAPIVGSDGWYEYYFDVTTTSATTYVIFKAISAYGNNMFLDDIKVEAPPAPCSGTPTAGTVSPSTQNICSGATPGNMTLSGFSSGVTGISFQWQESADNTNWTNVSTGSGATSTSFTPASFAGSTIYYRCNVTCDNSTLSNASSVSTVNPPNNPSTQASNLTFSNVTYTGFTASWTNGNGNRRVVYLSNSAIVDPTNTNGAAALTASTTYGGTGQQIVYDGTGTSVTISNLTLNTTYYVKVIEYTRCGSSTYDYYYNVSTGSNSNSVTTSSPTALPWSESFATTTTPSNWNITGWTIGSNRGVTGNPGNNIYKNLYASFPSGSFTTPIIGPITNGMKLFLNYKHSNYASPYASPGAGSGSFKVQVSSDNGSTFTDLATISNDNSSAWRSLNYDLSTYNNANLMIKIAATRSSGDWDYGFDNIGIHLQPSITTSGTLTAFSSYGAASSTQSFSVSGSNLIADINVNAPSGFEVSTNASTGFGSTLTLPQTNGVVTSQTIYVRMAALTSSPSTSNVTCESIHATTQNISVSGIVTNQWSGTTSTAWSTTTNWSCNAVPINTQNVEIPSSGITNYPVLSAAVTVKDMNIGSGTLGLNGQTLTINGTVSGTGTISGSSTSSIVIGANNAAGTLNFTSGSNTLKNLTLNSNSSATLGNALNIATGATPGVLTVNTGATLTTGGFLTMKSDATGTARVANSAGTISGEVTVERYIPQNSNRAWRALAVPTYSATQSIANSWQLGTLITGPGGANGLDQATGGFSMMSYNPATDALVGVGDMTSVISGNTAAPAAYYLYVRGDRNTGVANTNLNPTATTLSSKGSLYQGTVTVPAANNGSGTTYHLVGNPYISPINLNSFYTANSSNLDNTFYLFDPQIANTAAGVGGLITLTGSGSSYTPSVTGASYSGSISEIPSGMAFFITKSSGSASSIVFNESMKTTGSTVTNGYNGLKTTAAVDGQLQVNLNVKINDSTVRPADGILAIFDANEKVQVDGSDARKMSNFGENMAINNQGDLLAIEKRPLFTQDTLHINITGLTNRLYSLRFNPSQFQNASSALLIDHYTNSTQSILLQSVSEYAFTIDANAQSKGPNRFDVVFEQAALQITTTKKLMAIELYPNPVSEGVINISMHQQKEGNYTVSIVNALGAEIQKENWHHSNGDQIHSINVNKLASGIYYLKISNEFGDQSMHKFIQSSSNF